MKILFIGNYEENKKIINFLFNFGEVTNNYLECNLIVMKDTFYEFKSNKKIIYCYKRNNKNNLNDYIISIPYIDNYDLLIKLQEVMEKIPNLTK